MSHEIVRAYPYKNAVNEKGKVLKENLKGVVNGEESLGSS